MIKHILKYTVLTIAIIGAGTLIYALSKDRQVSTLLDQVKPLAPIKKIFQTEKQASPLTPIEPDKSGPSRIASHQPLETTRKNISQQSLALILRGIINGGTENAQAIIEHTDIRVQRLYKTGDPIANGMLVSIMKTEVVIRVNGIDRVLTIGSGFGAEEVSPATSEQTISRAALDDALKNANQLISQIDLTPYRFEDGSAGLIAKDIVPGSLFDRAGLQDGDIIREINGARIENPSRLSALYKGLKLMPLELSLENAGSKSNEVVRWLDNKAGGVMSEVSKVQQKLVSGEDIPVKIFRNGQDQTITFSVK